MCKITTGWQYSSYNYAARPCIRGEGREISFISASEDKSKQNSLRIIVTK